ncbi:MAG: DUF4386 domain-containing protein [Hyphomicrobiales bacterium]|nr:MAG: DUF4386 domain-containing protein [Hyphomicrobiales bacterium]
MRGHARRSSRPSSGWRASCGCSGLAASQSTTPKTCGHHANVTPRPCGVSRWSRAGVGSGDPLEGHMSNDRMLSGALMIAVPVVFASGFAGLQMVFDYPDILRHPAGEVLTRFAAAGVELHLFWYAMMAAALAFIPAAIALALYFRASNPTVAAFSAGFGILAGLVQALGLLRWVMLVPVLAASYVAPDASEARKEMAMALFDTANRYLGMGVGEHLGYLFTALWTLTIAMLVWQRFRWLALAGVVIAAGVAFGMLEPFGVAGAGDINSIAFSAWALWALALGVVLLWRGKDTVMPAPLAA